MRVVRDPVTGELVDPETGIVLEESPFDDSGSSEDAYGEAYPWPELVLREVVGEW